MKVNTKIVGALLGASILLSGCGISNEDKAILQEVKNDVSNIKSGRMELKLNANDANDKGARLGGFELSGDINVNPYLSHLKGKFQMGALDVPIDIYSKDGKIYTHYTIEDQESWDVSDLTVQNSSFDYKAASITSNDGILQLLDEPKDWEIKKNGDKVTVTLKKDAGIKEKVKDIYKQTGSALAFEDLDYTIAYEFDNKTKDVTRTSFILDVKVKNVDSRMQMTGSMDELNKEVKVDLPEDATRKKTE